MKKILLSIFWIFLWLSAFCSADSYIFSWYNYLYDLWDYWFYDCDVWLVYNWCDVSSWLPLFYFSEDNLIFHNINCWIGIGWSNYVYFKNPVPCLSNYDYSYSENIFECSEDLDWWYTYWWCFLYNSISSDTFTVNYWSTSKEYTITEDIDIFINSPVIKNWNTFTFDWSTWINLVYNWSYNWYTKNKLYLWWQFWYKQGVFTPICM